MRIGKNYLFRVCYSKGVSHHHSHCQTQRQVEEWESFRVEGKEDFRDAPIEGWLLA